MTFVPGLAGLVALLAGSGPAAAEGGACRLSPRHAHFIQQALDGWREVSVEALRLEPKPLPWMVLFDRKCVWHLAPEVARLRGPVATAIPVTFSGQPVAAYARPHRGLLALPDGRRLPPRPVASTSTYGRGKAAFFAMALPEVWRRDPRFADMPDLERFFLGVLLHELVHTRQIVAIQARIRRHAVRHGLARLRVNDDLIQRRFQRVPGFRRAFEAERDLFFRAVAERQPARKRALTAEALAMARRRQARFFVGANRRYAELEELFLTMEGAGQFAAYHFARQAPGGPTSEAAAVELVRDNKRFWSQEEGLALFLLLEALVPDWQAPVLGPALTSPFTLLEAATRSRSSASARRAWAACPASAGRPGTRAHPPTR